MRIDYEGLESYRVSLNDSISKMKTAIKEAKDLVDKMDNNDAWTGDGYQEFQNKMARLESNLLVNLTEAKTVVDNLNSVITKYKYTDKKLGG